MLFRCSRCLYPNTKPDLWFDGGICSACLAFDKRKEIDWSKRQDDFLEFVREHRGESHDVIVACSGGKDSTWQVVKCLELGLRPLAVCATTDHLSSLGRRNLDNIATLCDLIEVTPHKGTRKKIAKFALKEVGDISWPEHHLIWSVPAREAVARKIPIVLYGECPQNEYGAGPAGSEINARLTKDWMDEFGGLLGLRLSDLSDVLGVDGRHLDVYRYPDGEVSALFMGSYFDWDGKKNATVARQHGFTTLGHALEGSFVEYENLDNLQTGIHDYLRWLKFGYGRTCDIASSWIRRGYLTRREGAALCLERDGKWPATCLGVPLDQILANIDVGISEFEQICAQYTNRAAVEWASKPASFQSYCGTTTDASKGEASIPAGVSAQCSTDSAYWNDATLMN